jgi:photosystem II stability/assembly factor-like uncharacterized protein
LHAFAVGIAGDVYRTSDGGDTWVRTSFNPSRALTLNLRFLDAKKGFVLGTGDFESTTLFRTENGGETWERLSIPMTFMAVPVRKDAIPERTR